MFFMLLCFVFNNVMLFHVIVISQVKLFTEIVRLLQFDSHSEQLIWNKRFIKVLKLHEAVF